MSTQGNEAILRRALEAWNNPDRRSEYFQIYAPDAKIHAHGATNVEGLRQFYDAIAVAFPDAYATVEEVVVEGDKLAYRVTVNATHKGPFARLMPTGKSITITEVGILHFANGKVVSRWGEDDAAAALQRLQK